MEAGVIKLKINKKSLSIEASEFIKKAFIHACKHLDTSSFEPLIEDEENFEKMDKHLFLQEMKERFEYLKSEGVKDVKEVVGICEMCFKGDKVHEFYVNTDIGKPVFAYNIQEKNGLITEIFRCNYSNGYKRDAQECMRSNPNVTFPFLDNFYKSVFKK